MITILILLPIVLLFGRFILRPNEWKNEFSGLKFTDFWNWNGQIERGPYLFLGAVLFFIKHNLDRYAYYHFYHQHTWRFLDDLYLFSHIGQRLLTSTDFSFFTTILLLAIPFIYIGVGLTIKRLRAVQLRYGWPDSFLYHS